MAKRTKSDWPGKPKCQNVQKLIGQENTRVKTYKNDWPGEHMCLNVQK